MSLLINCKEQKGDYVNVSLLDNHFYLDFESETGDIEITPEDAQNLIDYLTANMPVEVE